MSVISSIFLFFEICDVNSEKLFFNQVRRLYVWYLDVMWLKYIVQFCDIPEISSIDNYCDMFVIVSTVDDL